MKLINHPVYKGVQLDQRRLNLYGVEIELENYKGKENFGGDFGQYWNVTDDPSLRHGVEFVSTPLSANQMKMALDKAHKLISKSKLTSGSRCGIHVHVNMLNLTWGQMWSFIALYSLLEPEVFAKWAPERHENHFCVPIFWNTKMVNELGRDINFLRSFNVGDVEWKTPQITKPIYRDPGGFHNPTESTMAYGPGGGPRRRWFPLKKYLSSVGRSKYGALTIFRLCDLGTVEFRLLPGTTDVGVIKEWVAFLGRMKYQAMKYSDPLELQAEYETHGPDYFWTKLKAGVRPRIKAEDKDDAEESAFKLIGVDILDKNDYEWKIGDK